MWLTPIVVGTVGTTGNDNNDDLDGDNEEEDEDWEEDQHKIGMAKAGLRVLLRRQLVPRVLEHKECNRISLCSKTSQGPLWTLSPRSSRGSTSRQWCAAIEKSFARRASYWTLWRPAAARLWCHLDRDWMDPQGWKDCTGCVLPKKVQMREQDWLSCNLCELCLRFWYLPLRGACWGHA